MGNICLSYLTGGKEIKDEELVDLGVSIEEKSGSGNRAIKIPNEKLMEYRELIKAKLEAGFWNDVIGEKEIIFIFKFKDGSIREYELSLQNEQEIDDSCAESINEPKTVGANVFKMLADNKFYHDFMLRHYSDMINRK